MFTVSENTTIVGVSEIRAQWQKIREAMLKGRVEVALRHKPEAVLLLKEQADAMDRLLDRVEDYALAIEAFQREQKARPEDYISLEDALKKLA